MIVQKGDLFIGQMVVDVFTVTENQLPVYAFERMVCFYYGTHLKAIF